jgi:hypothetical protein
VDDIIRINLASVVDDLNMEQAIMLASLLLEKNKVV